VIFLPTWQHWANILFWCLFSFGWGLIGSIEFTHMSNKVDCFIPLRYGYETIEKHWHEGVEFLGLRFKTAHKVYYEALPLGRYRANVYKVECIGTLYNIYLAGGRKDMGLRAEIKKMEYVQ